MVALVATIHVFLCRQRASPLKKAWMVGLKPTMTVARGIDGGAT
jgi:hypothetical protein